MKVGNLLYISDKKVLKYRMFGNNLGICSKGHFVNKTDQYIGYSYQPPTWHNWVFLCSRFHYSIRILEYNLSIVLGC